MKAITSLHFDLHLQADDCCLHRRHHPSPMGSALLDRPHPNELHFVFLDFHTVQEPSGQHLQHLQRDTLHLRLDPGRHLRSKGLRP